MRTQGWRRYNIAALAQGRYSHPSMPLELSAEITGTVKSVLTGRPVNNVKVSLMAYDGYVDETTTDSEGRFSFDCDPPDSTWVILSAVPQRGMVRMDLIVDVESFPPRELSAVPSAEIDARQFAIYAEKAEQQYRDEGGIRVYDLPEVTITAERKQPKQSAYYPIGFAKSITEDELKERPPGSMRDLLLRIPNVHILPNGQIVTTNARISINASMPLLLLLDDVSFEIETIEDLESMLSPLDVAQIDVLNPIASDLFSLKFNVGGGIISIFTKKGEYNSNKIPSFHIKTIYPLGYQQPVEFYSPKYDSLKNAMRRFQTCGLPFTGNL